MVRRECSCLKTAFTLQAERLWTKGKWRITRDTLLDFLRTPTAVLGLHLRTLILCQLCIRPSFIPTCPFPPLFPANACFTLGRPYPESLTQQRQPRCSPRHAPATRSLPIWWLRWTSRRNSAITSKRSKTFQCTTPWPFLATRINLPRAVAPGTYPQRLASRQHLGLRYLTPLPQTPA